MVVAEVVSKVGVITLNCPERRNALHPDILDAVPRVLKRFEKDPDVGCVLMTSAGTAFCAGGDVRDGGRRRPPDGNEAVPSAVIPAEARTHDARMVRALHEMPKITLAALQGTAVGAGLSIALTADLRSATLVPAWVRLALSGDFGGTWFISRLLGPSRALEWLMSGDAMDAATALNLGLVNWVVDDAELPAAALSWAATIAEGPTQTWSLMKANVAGAQVLSLAEVLPREGERLVQSSATDDHKRAVRAWLDAAARRSRRLQQ